MKSTSIVSNATSPIKPEVMQDLVNFAFYMKKNGLADGTIVTRIQALKQLARMTNLKDPEQVKQTITSQKWKSLSKRRYVETYIALLKYLGITWTKPHIAIESRLPFIPTETEIDQLIASMGSRLATLLQTLKETGARISEAVKLKWTDVSTEQRTLNITPSKNSNPRLIHVSDKLLNMINALPHNKEHVFAQRIQGLRYSFNVQRKAAARRLQNPRIQKISFHTFRHWKGTMLYHTVKDIVTVKNFLGHKNIGNTMIYINIESALFLEQNDEWISKAAKTPDECMKLIEVGFTLADTIDGIHIYRKRK